MGKIILKLKFKETWCGLESSHSGLWSVAGTWEHGKVPLHTAWGHSYVHNQKGVKKFSI
jgi:hypothetical protein